MRTLAAAALAASLAGCAATHHLPPMPEPARGKARLEIMPRWVVGVREPVVRYRSSAAAVPDLLDEVRDSARLIDMLRRTGLFAEVDFSEQLQCPADIELAVVARQGERLRPAPLWLLPLTLSLSILESEDGISFSAATDPGVVFDFPYPTTFVMGLLPLLASPVVAVLPTWSLMRGGPVDEELKLFLLSNADRLRALAGDGAPTECSSPVAGGSRARIP